MGAEYVIVEKDPARVEELRAFLPDALVLEADATHDQVLLEAGLARARGLVACLSADTDNLFVCLSARDLAATVKIVARAYEEETMDKLYRAGADHVVSPNVSSAIRMASVLLRPSAVSFLDIATRSSELALRMEQAIIGESSEVAGRTLMEARIPQRTGLIVIALRKRSTGKQDFVFNPVGDTRLGAGDEVIVLGKEEQIAALRTLVG
jgi:voltage-gated potassium channel